MPQPSPSTDTWTEERVETLKQLWAEGRTASQSKAISRWRNLVFDQSLSSSPKLSTYAGQTAHYAAVRARLGAPRLQVSSGVKPSVITRPANLPLVRKPGPPPAYGCPINLIGVPSARFLIKLVSIRTGISCDDIVGPRRRAGIMEARKMAVRLVYDHCKHLSLPMIGKIFNRDHTTVLHLMERTKKSRRLKGAE